MKQIVLVKPGILSDSMKRKVERAGAVLIETDDFTSVKIMQFEPLVSSEDLAIAAVDAISRQGYDSARKIFIESLLVSMRQSKQ